MYGASSLKKLSRINLSSWSLAWWEALLLLGSGALAVVLHQFLRAPLGLPGRHGIEWMALLILGRASSRFRGAGSLASLGASVTSSIPIWGARDDPFIWLIYLLPGPLMDLLFWLLPKMAGKLWFLVLLGGLAHATKPIARLVIAATMGWAYGSFRYGILYPITSHILYGLLGGFLGGVAALGVHWLGKRNQH
jgi:hypothetical protein